MRQAFLQTQLQPKGRHMIIAKQSPLLESAQALLRVIKHLDLPPQRRILRTTSSTRSIAQEEPDRQKRPLMSTNQSVVVMPSTHTSQRCLPWFGDGRIKLSQKQNP